jgi:hypothetical protein
MFGVWLERRRFRKCVLETLMLMLENLGLKSPKILLRHYPGVENAILDHFHRGVGYRDCCIAVVASVLPDQIEHHYGDDQRAIILDQLTAKGMSFAAKAPIARAILSAEDFAHRWSATGNVEEESRDLMMNEIIGALQGFSPEERSRRRFDRAFSQLVHPAGS